MVVAAAVVVAVEVHRCQIEKESPEHEADRASLTWALPQHSVVFPPLCGHDDSLFGGTGEKETTAKVPMLSFKLSIIDQV